MKLLYIATMASIIYHQGRASIEFKIMKVTRWKEEDAKREEGGTINKDNIFSPHTVCSNYSGQKSKQMETRRISTAVLRNST